jgi:hypothetical protein
MNKGQLTFVVLALTMILLNNNDVNLLESIHV